MSASELISFSNLSPNNSGTRTHSIDRITPHCIVGQLSAESVCNMFADTGRQASSNYVIGTDGTIALCVDEDDCSWCSSSPANDQRAITIECASDAEDPYAFNDDVYQSLTNLCIDICRRYNKNRLIWIDDKEQALDYEPGDDEMLLTVHRWFAAKACPGDWMMEHMGELADNVTGQL